MMMRRVISWEDGCAMYYELWHIGVGGYPRCAGEAWMRSNPE